MTDPARRPPYGWIVVLGVLSAAPYGVVNDTLGAVWRHEGVDKDRITKLIADAGWPWALKFVWAPLVDRFASRRAWIVAGALTCAALVFGLSQFAPSDTGPAVFALVLALSFASATQDIAIDAYAVEALPPGALGIGNGLRVTAYRAGLLVFGGLLIGRVGSWGAEAAWRAAAGALALGGVCALLLPSAPRSERAETSLVAPLVRLVKRKDFAFVVAFVVLFKACDYAMPPPLTKALLIDRGIGLQTIGDVLTPIGIGATVLGALLGGWVTTRIGIFKALWVLGAFQALSNLVYAGAAASDATPLLYVAAVVEPFSAGLGTAPFLAFLMACCDRGLAATQFALWSAFMAVGRWGFGRWSGAGAEQFGYASWFAMTFVAAIPAFALLPFIKRRLESPPISNTPVGIGDS